MPVIFIYQCSKCGHDKGTIVGSDSFNKPCDTYMIKCLKCGQHEMFSVLPEHNQIPKSD